MLENSEGASLRLLAGEWEFGGEKAASPLNDLAGNAAIADLRLSANGQATLSLAQHKQAFLYIHTGELGDESEHKTGTLLLLDAKEMLNLVGGENGAGVLIFGGQKIKEKIAHHGPFVMNTPDEIEQAIRDYQAGKFGAIA